MSYTTRLMPLTSLMMRREIRPRTSYGNLRELGGHRVRRGHTAKRHDVLVGPSIAHHPDALDRQEDDERLPDLVVETGGADLLDQDRVGLPQWLEPCARHLAEDPDRETRPRERMASDGARRQPELAAERTDLVLEELPQRLDEPELHVLGQSADVVMRLDRDGFALDGDALDHVRDRASPARGIPRRRSSLPRPRRPR